MLSNLDNVSSTHMPILKNQFQSAIDTEQVFRGAVTFQDSPGHGHMLIARDPLRIPGGVETCNLEASPLYSRMGNKFFHKGRHMDTKVIRGNRSSK